MTRRGVTVLVRTAAGPRLGYGHLARTRSLTAALPLKVTISIRGPRRAFGVARSMRLRVAAPQGPGATIARVRPSLLVVDDPSARYARPWVNAARRFGIPAASIHDLGRGLCGADLAIDGSVVRTVPWPRGVRALAGLRYAILQPEYAAARRASVRGRVLIALGGGPRERLARAIADAIVRRVARAEPVIAGGFGARTRGRVIGGRVGGLREALARADVAIVAGGVTLYEAITVGVPVAALPVVAAQEPTARAFAARGLTEYVARGPHAPGRVALAVERLFAVKRRRSCPALDGRGAARVAAALEALALRGETR